MGAAVFLVRRGNSLRFSHSLMVRGPVSLKVSMDSAGKTISFSPVQAAPAVPAPAPNAAPMSAPFAAAGQTADEGSASCATADEGRSTFAFALLSAADRTCLHVVAVSVYADRLEYEPEYSGTLEAALRHGLGDFALYLCALGKDYFAV
jgi:hypothetical protein